MRRLRALCVWMLAFAILFAMSACRTAEKKVTYAYNYAPGTLSDGSMTEERADAYLLANGYPQDFVSDTGSVTKQWLAQEGAVFQSQSIVADNDIAGISWYLTASDLSLPEQKISIKYMTLNWKWNRDEMKGNSTVSLNWEQYDIGLFSEYNMLSRYTLFEIFGVGSLEEARIPESGGVVPESTKGTFVVNTSIDRWLIPPLLGADIMEQTLENGTKVSYQFSVDPGSMFLKYFNKGGASDGENMTTGTYLIDPTSYCGSFSVKLIKEVDGSDANSDGNNVVQASYFLGDEESGVNCHFTDFM